MENIIATFVETLGLGVFFYYLIRGLKAKIKALEDIISVQGKTLEVMERRVHETEKVGDIYRNLISDLPKDLDNYKTVISKTKDETILELQNQHENIKQKLKETQKQIEQSRNSSEVISRHLTVLKNILSKPTVKEPSFKHVYDLASICTYGGRSLEKCIPIIIESPTLDACLKKLGFEVIVKDDKIISNEVFNKQITPKGHPLKSAMSSENIGGGWHLIANDEFYLNNLRLNELKDEFSAIKIIT